MINPAMISALCAVFFVLHVGQHALAASSESLLGHRHPIISSGDRIALRMSYTNGSNLKYYMHCTTSYCYRNNCPGDTVIKSDKWSKCKSMTYIIRAIGKSDSQPINSGDMVTISSGYYGNKYHLRCSKSTSYKCRFSSINEKKFEGNHWFENTIAIFQIFSRNAIDNTPVQYGDIVGLRYPYYYADRWLYHSGGHWYARKCSNTDKKTCAKTDSPTGFQIFKPR
ncbi:uncharacterized protein LOC116603464 [Nematostella vectensis]|uniref:uncharacterized protein LOC116603464 n=1 Tax=Nematostella vectensis TaxID=45351 RepID=UPI002076E1B7|nr:uncharacterized protein LOC116603464 [Nematostella vectensis]